jgi:hypothetical protein
MFRAWGFALTLALCCTLGWSTAHATGKITKIVSAMGKSEFLVPDGTPVEQSEFEIKGIKSLWPTVPISCLLWAKCRHSLDQ